MGHNSQEGYFLGQELFLDFAAWIDLTSNPITWFYLRWKIKIHFATLKRVDAWLRVHQGFMMLLKHQAGMQKEHLRC